MTNLTMYSDDFERYSEIEQDDKKFQKFDLKNAQFSNYDALALVQPPIR